MKKILEEVLEEIKPNKNEKERMREISDKLVKKVQKKSSELGVSVKPKIVGSSARGTWLSKEKDIDIFLLFPKDTRREKLEKKGLEIGKEVAEGKGNEQYAEHPYINAEIDGFDVDIVPCYNVDDPANIQSAVDRSPHHQEYIEGWLTPERKDQVLLLKKFLKGIGVYGSKLKVQGFSGYLSELLISQFGSFPELIKSAKDWKSKKVIGLGDERSKEDLKEIFPDQPLIFIDPVDPGRNVAAALSKKNYAKFIRACQDLLEEPSKNFFFPNQPPSSKEKLQKLIESRSTKIFMISFEIPFQLVPDIVYPQLRKTKRSLVQKLEKSDFQVLRGGVWFKEQKGTIVLELKVYELPKIKEHIGPPLGVDSKPFVGEYLDSEEALAGPFVREDGRLIFELERTQTQAKEVLENSIESLEGFGSHIKKSIQKRGYKIQENGEIVKNTEDPDALKFLGDYLTHCLPWHR